ncbi:MAG TPA: isoaspartyl peptidase/L-asparaginase [Thermoanaerobaculia bacterium]|nr:isoaspartyl peptidase/L-asparaginase [Thermoanaerobaculia bacterium]
MFTRLACLTATIVFALGITAEPKGKTMFVIHGGAGTITRKSMTPEMEQQYRTELEKALRAGHDILAKGGTSLDAVEAAIRIMEDSPLFNAGKGAVFTHEGKNELDASIMDGKTLKAGAVAGVTILKNPITAARAVMEKSKHVMMVGRGAELFATKMGLEIVDPSYFWTERRWKALQQELLLEQKPNAEVVPFPEHEVKKFGTVGALALDQSGNLAAGTSTGGMTNKMYGRVGDSPIIGAGTYADNNSCAVSGTGDGEYFIRLSVARDIAALVSYRNMTVQQAGDEVIHKKLTNLGGEGGVIILDAKGNVAMPFNSEGMYRGWIGDDGVPHVLIYKD